MAKPGRHAKAKLNIPMCLAGVLFCLTLFSFHLSSGVVARYTATAAGSDSARVIQFGDLTLTKYGAEKQHIYPGGTLEWNAEVSFTGSESATYVFLKVSDVYTGDKDSVTPVEGGPSWPVNKGPGKWQYLTSKSGSRTCIYYLELAPNAALDKFPLFTSGKATVSEDLTAAALEGMSTDAKFRAYVVQSNGFGSPEAAWTSLATH